MNVSFETSFLRDRCEHINELEDWLGSICALALIRLISDIEAFDNALQLFRYLGSDIEVNEDDTLYVTIDQYSIAILHPVGTKFRRQPNKQIDWSTVNRIKLTEVRRTT